MPKTIYITESQLKKLVNEDLTKNDVKSVVKGEISDYVGKNRAFEKRVKEITADVIKELFKTLWQKNNLYSADIKS